MKIAVCDDDMATREHIVTLIKEQIRDTAVVTFASGEEMLKAKEDFDISFLDVKMKELSGIDVAKEIQRFYQALYEICKEWRHCQCLKQDYLFPYIL